MHSEMHISICCESPRPFLTSLDRQSMNPGSFDIDEHVWNADQAQIFIQAFLGHLQEFLYTLIPSSRNKKLAIPDCPCHIFHHCPSMMLSLIMDHWLFIAELSLNSHAMPSFCHPSIVLSYSSPVKSDSSSSQMELVSMKWWLTNALKLRQNWHILKKFILTHPHTLLLRYIHMKMESTLSVFLSDLVLSWQCEQGLYNPCILDDKDKNRALDNYKLKVVVQPVTAPHPCHLDYFFWALERSSHL